MSNLNQIKGLKLALALAAPVLAVAWLHARAFLVGARAPRGKDR